MVVRDINSARSFPQHDITGASTQRSVVDGVSRKGQARCNISSETGSRRELVGVVKDYRVRDG